MNIDSNHRIKQQSKIVGE